MNEEYNRLFPTDDIKAKAFDEIATQYYAGNFGRMTKTEFETLLFRLYMNRHIASDGMNIYSDFQLSKELGITQARIRSLRIQKDLRYPNESVDWREIFADCVKNAKYDDVKRLVKVNIPDVTVLIELRNFVEAQGWYDEYQLNPKLFQCRLDYFVSLCALMENEEISTFQLDAKAKEQIKIIEEHAGNEKEKTAIEKIMGGAFNDGLKDFLISAGKEGIILLLNLLPFGGLAAKAIGGLIKVLEK